MVRNITHGDFLQPSATGGKGEPLFVVARLGQNVETEAILAYCKARLSAYKIPHAVHLIAEIPRTGSGKIIRYKLKETLKA